jgi:RimJ/RimL family protein N-acetyltransferase
VLDGLAFLRLEAATTFLLDDRGRILRENDPDHSPGPRVAFVSCAKGGVAHVRADIDDGVAARIVDLFRAEPAWMSPDARPDCLADVLALLEPTARLEASLSYRMPHRLPVDSQWQCLDSETDAGEAFLAALRTDGIPRHLTEAGFASVADFWPPWCVLIEDGVIAAMAFAARISAEGAAVGVYTFPQFRGRGLAAAVTARWSSHHTLADRKLFYGTSVTNTASQRVAARLGLEQVGMMLRVV